MKRLFYISVLLLFLASCEKQSQWTLKTVQSDEIIVDGMVTNQPGSHLIRLTFPIYSLNEKPRAVTGATVILSNNETVTTLTEIPVGSGNYYTNPGYFAKLNREYTLMIYFQGNVFTAKASMVPGSMFKTVRYLKTGNQPLYHIDWVANTFHTINPAMWEILLDWSKVPGYVNQPDSLCKARLLYYTLPTLDVSQIFAPEMQKINFPAGTRIVEKRYSLTPQHAEFIREMLLETNWTGGLFGSASSNIPSNLTAGARGYFGVCAVTVDSLVVH